MTSTNDSPAPLDPLDEPSGCSIFVRDDSGKTVERELTFREMHEYCARGIKYLDETTPKVRLIIQKEMDPHYKPLAPYEGLTRFRRRLR